MRSNPVCGAIGLAVGVYLLSGFSWKIIIIAGALIAAVLFLSYFLLKKNIRIPAVLLIFTVVGGILGGYTSNPQNQPFYAFSGHYVVLTGRVSELVYLENGLYHYVLETDRAVCGGQEIRGREFVRVSADQYYPYNKTISCTGFLKEYDSKRNDSSIDLKNHYRVKGIFHRLYAVSSHEADSVVINHSPYAFANGVRSRISDLVTRFYQGTDDGILTAVFTGNRKAISTGLRDQLLRTGLYRYLYASFIHLMLLFWLSRLLFAGLPAKHRNALLLIVFVLYAVFNSNSPTALKAGLYMAVTAGFAAVFGNRHLPDNLSCAVILCGLYHPLIFYDSGFVISIVFSLLMILFYQPLDQYLYRSIPHKHLRRAIVISVLGVIEAPLNAWFFNGYYLYSVMAGLIFVPVVLLLLATMPVLLLMMRFLHTTAGADTFIGLLLSAVRGTAALIDRLPFSEIFLPKPSAAFLIGWALTVISLRWYVLKEKRQARAFLASAAGIFLSVLCIQLGRIQTLELSFIDVDQGDAALIQIPWQKNILIDAGGGMVYSDYNYGETELLPYLKDRGVWCLDAVILSHYDKDHAYGLLPVMDQIKIKEIFMPNCLPRNEYRVMIEKKATQNRTKITYVSHPGAIDCGAGTTLRFVYPLEQLPLTADDNEHSLVARIEFGAFSALFTGDISVRSERKLLSSGTPIQSDILKVPHHGSDTSSSKAFIHAVSPKIGLIGAGRNNSYGLPKDEIVSRYESFGTRLFRTDECGTIFITADKNGIRRVQTYLHPPE